MYSVHKKQGFSLAELLVVISIIGLLSSVIIVSVSNARQNSRDKVRIVDIEQLRLTLRLYAEENGTYPSSNGPISGIVGLNAFGSLPTDPINDSTHSYQYDSAYDCNGSTKKVVYATAMETSGMANEDIVCGTTGGTKYIQILGR